MAKYIAYYRVSTARQGASGLGLDAQREAVASYLRGVNAGNDQPVAEYTEVECGKRSVNRPQLLTAIEHCKRVKATLVIAKLDRLARNVHFISGLMESKVPFVAVDMPDANKLTVHVMAAMAEYEAQAISDRTKVALSAARAKGTVLGNPRWHESIAAARDARKLAPIPTDVIDMMRELQASGLTLRAIADKLNALGLRTPQGALWYASTVRGALNRDRVAA
jgi:DNA invertase Pin-like site-specific DNA recombinase